MSDHTPGPWTVEEDSEGLMVMMEPLAGKDEYLAVYASPNREQREADAYLIAAAPDLLAVLEEVMPDGVTLRGDTFNAEAWLEKARAALKKARGAP